MRLLFVVLVCSLPAFADILPDDVAVCHGKSAGQKCTTDEGLEGTCQETLVSRPDYSSGIPPTYKQVKMLTCVAPGKAASRSMVWIGFGLGFFALLMAMLFGRRGGPNSPAPA
ncbi:MAG: hypothetical protein JNM17_17360 [Archangium sp.]|nr:hypothetical protein [Archangium sp.]